MRNATYLFQEPQRDFRNSESRWTTIAQISLFYISRHLTGHAIPVYNADNSGHLAKNGPFEISGFGYSNTVCEAGLKGEVFDIPGYDNRFHALRPDITHFDKSIKRTVFIEVKTLKESVRRNIDLYDDLKEYFTQCGWDCRLLYLMSHGHEIKQDWPALCRTQSSVILWEDLFAIMSETPLSFLIGESLERYCQGVGR